MKPRIQERHMFESMNSLKGRRINRGTRKRCAVNDFQILSYNRQALRQISFPTLDEFFRLFDQNLLCSVFLALEQLVPVLHPQEG